MKSFLTVVATSAILLVSGCSGSYYQFPRTEFQTEKYEDLGPSDETATGILLFGLIPIGLTDKIERATNAAITKRRGDILVNVTVRERWYWAYILTIYKVDVAGTVLKTK